MLKESFMQSANGIISFDGCDNVPLNDEKLRQFAAPDDYILIRGYRGREKHQSQYKNAVEAESCYGCVIIGPVKFRGKDHGKSLIII